MSQDDRFILQEILKQENQRVSPRLNQDKFFEIFSADQVMKSLSLDLDLDQVKSGIVANGGDGEMSLAKTKLEESVMWAVKHVTR